jgi:hypothetical protein
MCDYNSYDFIVTDKKVLAPSIKLDADGIGEGYLPRNCIPWSESLKNELTYFFSKCSYPYRETQSIPFSDEIRSEIYRFFLSLDGYLESSNPVIPEKDILYGAADIGYANTLKRIKRKSFLKTWRADPYEFPDWWDDVPDYVINDIGDIFNYSYLIFFKEDDPMDIEFSKIEVNIDPKWLKKFKDTLREILPWDGFNIVEEFEILTTLSSSMCYDNVRNEKSPHYLKKSKFLKFSKRMGKSKRSVIRVSPCNTRDSVILCPDDLNTISLMDKQVSEILKKIPQHIHLSDKTIVKQRIDSLFRNFDLFVQRDIRKEGLTKPRELLKAMLEVLHDEYPDIKIFSYTDFYDSFCVLDENDEEIETKRGHGLGMANSLTTLMQLTIHNLIVEELSNDIPDIDARCLALNDDFVVAFNDDYHMDEYWDMEDEVMGYLSILRAPEKSFYSYRSFVLAENYITPDGWWEKESYQRRELLYPLACYNIVHAKEYFISAQCFTNEKYARSYIGEIVSKWGYEFHPNEVALPSIFGGWLNDSISGVDMSLKALDAAEYNSLIPKGWKACRYKFHVQRKGDNFLSPLFELMGSPIIPDEFRDQFDNITMNELNSKYGKVLTKSTKEFKKYWVDLREGRLKIFKKDIKMTFEELILEVNKTLECKQFYPCDSMVHKYHRGNYIGVNIKDIYIDPNPKLALVSKYNETSYEFKEDYSIRFTQPDSHSNKKSNLYSKEVEKSIKNRDLANLIISQDSEVYYPDENSFNPAEQYLNPIGIGEVITKINWGIGYPELKDEFKHPLIESKRSVFGRLLTIDELQEITRSGITREVLKLIIDKDLDIIETIKFLSENREEAPILDKLIKPEPVEEIPQTGEFEIGIPDCLVDGVPKFWKYYQDKNQGTYTFLSKDLERWFGQLSCLIIYFTAPEGHFPDEVRLKEMEKFRNQSSICPILLRRSGVESLYHRESLIDAEDDGDWAGDLFGEEWD